MLRHSCLPFATASMQEMHLQREFYQSVVKKKTPQRCYLWLFLPILLRVN